MKLDDKIGNVIISKDIVIEKFKIKVDKRAFKLLYGDLYSHPIKAIIRELSTNAADSHVEAGKSATPFKVHLPSTLEPYFSIKDFGVGMSPEKVRDTYTIVCESDKTHSNEYTGCLGLGSKSPFAYAESFSVESIYNGKKYVYACFLNGEGEPCFAEIVTTDTDECNGVEIKFPVERVDFDQFTSDAKEVYKWFKVKPTINDESFATEEEEYLVSASTYGVYKEGSTQSKVVMGNIAYPINLGSLSWNQLTNVEREVVSWGVDLFAETGDVEFVPSREHLSYSNKTVNYIKSALRAAIEAVGNELDNQLKNQTSIWKAKCLLYKIKNSILGMVRPGRKITYNGTVIDEQIQEPNDSYGPNFHTLRKKMNRKGVERFRYVPVLSIVAHEDALIYLNDVHGGRSRVVHYLKENNKTEANIILRATPEFLKKSGLEEVVVKVSTLPKISRKQREISGSSPREKRTVVQEYKGRHYNGCLDYWNDIEIDLKDGGVYVSISYGQILNDKGYKTYPESILDQYKHILILDPDFKLYGIRPADLGKLAKYGSKWKKYNDYVTALVNKHATLVSKIPSVEQYNSVKESNARKLEIFASTKFSVNHPIRNFLEKFEEIKKIAADPKLPAVKYLLSKEPLSAGVLVALYDKVKKTYPMLAHIDWYGNVDKAVVDYVRLVDSQTALNIAV